MFFMKELDRKILETLAKLKESVPAAQLSEKAGVPYATLMSVLAGLEADGLLVLRRVEDKRLELTDEGREYLEKGLPERRLIQALGKKALALSDAFEKAALGPAEQGIALMWAKKNGWLKIDAGKASAVMDKVSDVEAALKSFSDGNKIMDAAALVQRKLARELTDKSVFATISSAGKAALKGDSADSGSAVVSSLTPEMLKTGSWKGKTFRPYDLKTVVAPVSVGQKHPYQEFLQRIRDKLIGLGFQEAHGPLVELEFWNLDALFMAQDHPAREIHDVFLLEDPARGEILDSKSLEQVKKAHEEGLDGSKGWRYKWDPEIAMRLCLRSQTTAVSARTLAKGQKPPLKMFSIGRVFRPDEIDWKHFIEFNQCEGIVMDPSMSLRELLGYLKRFAVEVFGAEDVRFAPSYFPFTEPSVELYAKIPGRGWAEVGGAGMFRPEMTQALGINVPVLAWGLGIDRLAMVSTGITDIRDLFSHDLGYLRSGVAKSHG